ncbi:hypothetical protein C9374_013004 [Naegleria lovaniensis]|uniref:Protoporphyrinogen oxidase n=1 Tax=Naegleria lovaniensis TaxID=51637 RepID=A0AA88GE74_NAELO|nr:uncharacterized protein C9374_013004 [Naegleria lovaniensis]KAG2372974.1 hypothetical protein C9374_013004 [Naegleria lovaniensis]
MQEIFSSSFLLYTSRLLEEEIVGVALIVMILVLAAMVLYIVLSEYLTRRQILETSCRFIRHKASSAFLGATISFESTSTPHVIIGGGIAGLLCACICKSFSIPFKLYEKDSQRTGGLLGTFQMMMTNTNNGREEIIGIAEQAANGILWSQEVEYLLTKIGISDLNEKPVNVDNTSSPILITPKKTAKARYFYRNGSISQLPLTLWEILYVLCWRMWRLPLRTGKKSLFDTLEEFFIFYMGETVTRQILEPAFSGIYGTTLNNLSFEGTMVLFPKLMEHSVSLPLAIVKYSLRNLWNRCVEKKHDTKKTQNKVGTTHSFKFGMQQFIDALQNYVGQEHIILGKTIDNLCEFDLQNSKIILTTPAYETCRILNNTFMTLHENSDKFEEWQQQIIDYLSSIRYTPIMTCTVIVKKSVFQKWKPGFGCLIPRNEGLSIMGVLFNSEIFEDRVLDEATSVSMTAILQDTDPNVTDENIQQRVISELGQLFCEHGHGTIQRISQMKLFRWKHGLPQYSPSLQVARHGIDRWLRHMCPNLTLFGNYTGQISIRGMITEAVKQMLKEQ